MTLIYMYHRAMIIVDWPIDRGSWVYLLKKVSDLRLFGIKEPNRSRSAMETELGFLIWRLPEREICLLLVERGTVSNHIVKIRCMNAP